MWDVGRGTHNVKDHIHTLVVMATRVRIMVIGVMVIQAMVGL